MQIERSVSNVDFSLSLKIQMLTFSAKNPNPYFLVRNVCVIAKFGHFLPENYSLSYLCSGRKNAKNRQAAPPHCLKMRLAALTDRNRQKSFECLDLNKRWSHFCSSSKKSLIFLLSKKCSDSFCRNT